MTDIQDLLFLKMFVVNNSLCGSSGCQASVIASFVNNNKSFFEKYSCAVKQKQKNLNMKLEDMKYHFKMI